MFTYMLWRDFRDKCKEPYIGFAENIRYKYNNEELTIIFILYILLTPFSIVTDLVGLPIELSYLIILKVMNKFRKDDE